MYGCTHICPSAYPDCGLDTSTRTHTLLSEPPSLFLPLPCCGPHRGMAPQVSLPAQVCRLLVATKQGSDTAFSSGGQQPELFSFLARWGDRGILWWRQRPPFPG